MRKLIVGKNSSIVKSIKDEIKNCEFISHRDLNSINANTYDQVYIFSWSHKSLSENLDILSKFDLTKLVFISTIAVLSIVKRTQWAAYPQHKRICENIVLKGGGKIIRIGIWHKSVPKNLYGTIPITSRKDLVKLINYPNKNDEMVFHPFNLIDKRINSISLCGANILNHISEKLPNIKYLQLPFLLINKLLFTNRYGYTHDCLTLFNNTLVVGYGAIGSEVSNKLNQKGIKHSVVVSPKPNLVINTNGFNNFYIGRNHEGLSNLWHGVSIRKKDSKTFYKHVPIIIKRPKVKSAAIKAHLTDVSEFDGVFELKLENSGVEDAKLFCRNLHLCAGVSENVSLLNKSFNLKAKFSDHEIASIGHISSKELYKHKYLKKYFFFQTGRKVMKLKYLQKDCLIDFRPMTGANKSNTSDEDLSIYKSRTSLLVKKILLRKSWRLINQAFFNKFGISIKTNTYEVHAQIPSYDCIEFSKLGNLERQRVPVSEIHAIQDELKKSFSTFKKSNIVTTDGIHLFGGVDLKKYPKLHELIKSQRLFMHGNSNNGELLGAFHHTKRLQKEALESLL